MVKDNRRKERARPARSTRPGSEGPSLASLTKTAEEIAHELSNLFMSISFSCNQLLAGVPEASPLRAAASAIAHDAAEGRSLSRKLRGLFYQAASAEPVDLNQLVKEAKSRLHGLITANIELDIVVSESPVLVEADPEDVERIITNLVINASDAMEKGGTLTIGVDEFNEVRASPSRLLSVTSKFGRLTVQHTGHPIGQQTLQSLLRPSAPAKSEDEETRMELAIVDAIVTRNDGYIEIESSQQLGTKISVLLPQPKTGAATGQGESPQNKSA
jgi:two-component system cell cycle sensor histidine kinase/response regulator CckA